MASPPPGTAGQGAVRGRERCGLGGAPRGGQRGAAGPLPQPFLRPSGERYLRERPEVAVLLRGLLREVMLRRPHDVLEFAAEYFMDPELPQRIRDQLGTPQPPQ